MESSGSGSSLSLKVAGQILRSDLGELVETVGVHLLEHGPCTLIQLASGLESTGSTLTATQIRASLLVLFQHNIASVAAPAAPPPAAPAQRGRAAAARPAAGNGGAAGSVSAAGKRPVYHASLDEVLARRWYPWVVCATRRRIGDDAAALLVEVLAVGRCTLDSLSRRLAPEGGARREALKVEVTRLLEARYLAAADQLEDDCGEPPLPLPSSAAGGAARGKRKREGGPAGGRGAEAGERGLLAREAKRLWRVNMPEMRQIFRADAMCKLMHEKFDATAAQLLDAVLAMQPPDLTHGAWPLPHSQEERGKPCTAHIIDIMLSYYSQEERGKPCTTPFTVEELVQECGPLLEGHEFESDRRQLVANYLDTMCNDPLCMMASPLNGKYMLNLAQMTAAIRQLALET